MTPNTAAVTPPVSSEPSEFETLGLSPTILKAVMEAGYKNPTPIQSKAIPLALAGKDLLASAQTGTGKTAAFMLPALHRLSTPSKVAKSKGPRVVVLTPTRELAMQITDAAVKYGRFLKHLSVVSILGGVPYFRQRQQMSRFVDIMVATPGRLIDYMEQGEIDFSRVEVLVLDEADRMLDMGFIDAVKRIVKDLPGERQTLLFSATIDHSIAELAKRLLKDPVRVEIAAQKARHESIDQKVHYVADLSAKKKLLTHILTLKEVKQVIVFTATKRAADKLADALYDDGYKVGALHGDMRQNARTKTIDRMYEGSLRILIATDVAARGIDVPGISHIINFDLPRVTEDYVHRIGRTGRAGATGTAISLVYPEERGHMRRIESFIGHPILPMTLPGFEIEMPTEGRREGRGGRNDRNGGGRPFRNRSSGSHSGGNRGGRFGGDRGGRGGERGGDRGGDRRGGGERRPQRDGPRF